MAAEATHEVVRDGRVPTRIGPDAAGSASGPDLDEGQRVALRSPAADGGWVEVELEDGSAVWVELTALAPLGLRHPPPPAPGTDAPVKLGGVRLTTQLFGGALLAVSTLLPWTSQYFESSTAFGVPLRVLLVGGTVETTGFVKLAFLLVPLAALVIAAGLRAVPPVVGQVAGGLAALAALVFIAQVQRTMGKFYAATVFGVLGIGVYLALLGGLLSAASTLSAVTAAIREERS